MDSPQVTIVCVPRERFSFTQESLDSVYENTQFPFHLVYVDNNAPSHIRTYLQEQAQEKGFQLVQSDYYLSPNQARNLGLRQVKTKYVIFLDNDVVVSQNWLRALVDCAEETNAEVVGSLVCQHEPFHEIIHCAGGEYMNPEDLQQFLSIESSSYQPKLRIREKIYRQGQRISEVRDHLKRSKTDFVEFHSVLVRTSIFEKIGMLDEKLSCTKEYLDLCMSVVKVGGSVYYEPMSVVTFRTHFPAPPLDKSDIPYYMLRWSNAWELQSLRHFKDKWNLEEDSYFTSRYKRLGWRRRIEIVKPFAARFHFLGKANIIFLERVSARLEKLLNRWITMQYAWRFPHTGSR